MLGFQNHFFNPISADAALSTKAVNKSQTHMSWEMVFKENSILNKNKLKYKQRILDADVSEFLVRFASSWYEQ